MSLFFLQHYSYLHFSSKSPCVDYCDFHVFTSASNLFSTTHQFDCSSCTSPKEVFYTGLLIGLKRNRWNPDAIIFNSSKHCGTLSCWAQKLFRESSGAILLDAKLQTNSSTLVASAITWQKSDGETCLKIKQSSYFDEGNVFFQIVNLGNSKVNLKVSIDGLGLNSQLSVSAKTNLSIPVYVANLLAALASSRVDFKKRGVKESPSAALYQEGKHLDSIDQILLLSMACLQLQRLMECAKAIEGGNLDVADSLLASIKTIAFEEDSKSTRLVVDFFVEALVRRAYGIRPLCPSRLLTFLSEPWEVMLRPFFEFA
ncbi:ALPHA-L-ARABINOFURANOSIDASE 1 [Salix koriyanagi]|uniref:ALPHA-L-ARABINOFURANOSIDASE 1 n=1 Tax=Salix koriyanagi TaxID=2511006 RepID=A0A9Q1APJ3_9ROSI|nr:ALPHA-L-ARABINOFURANOSIDASE 1 [Salix koriyanagi]